MAKLFALEEAEVGEEIVEMETAPEVGEVANVETEVAPEVTEVAEIESGVEEGMGAADQLEQVEEVVAQAAEGEGLDPVAAEAIKIAVEAICARIGANPKAVYSLYAAENFQSASSRKANTKYALEGVGEFLKDLWKKIKAALENLWSKVKAFWDKHISSLGQVKKALESMKSKVSASSGKVKEKAYLEEAPGALVAAFAKSGDIDPSAITAVINAHKAAGKAGDAVVESGPKAAKKAEETVKSATAMKLSELTGTWNLGTAAAPLVGGVYVTYKIEATDDNIEVTVEREQAERTQKAGVAIAEKGPVASLLADVLGLISEDVKAKAAFDKAQSEFSKSMVQIEKDINATVKNADTSAAAKPMRDALKVVYKANSKIPQITAERVSMNVKLAKAVLGYAALCVKNYK